MPLNQKIRQKPGRKPGKPTETYNIQNLNRGKKVWMSKKLSSGEKVRFPPEITPQLREISYWMDRQEEPVEAANKMLELLPLLESQETLDKIIDWLRTQSQ